MSSQPSSSRAAKDLVPYQRRTGYNEEQVYNNPLVEQAVSSLKHEPRSWRAESSLISRLPFKTDILRSRSRLDQAVEAYKDGAIDPESYCLLKVILGSAANLLSLMLLIGVP